MRTGPSQPRARQRPARVSCSTVPRGSQRARRRPPTPRSRTLSAARARSGPDTGGRRLRQARHLDRGDAHGPRRPLAGARAGREARGQDREPEARARGPGGAARPCRRRPRPATACCRPCQLTRTRRRAPDRPGSARHEPQAGHRERLRAGATRSTGIGATGGAQMPIQRCPGGRRTRSTRGSGGWLWKRPEESNVAAAGAARRGGRAPSPGVHRGMHPGARARTSGRPGANTARSIRRSASSRLRAELEQRAAGLAVAAERLVAGGALEQVGQRRCGSRSRPAERARGEHRRAQRLAHVHAGDAGSPGSRPSRAGCPAAGRPS